MPLPPSTLIPTGPVQRISIGGIVLSLNPQQMQETLPRQVVNLPVMFGYVRMDFGNGPRQWTIAGHTGQGGKAAILQLKTLEAQPGKAQKAVKMLYPGKYGTRVFMVYVDDCQWSEDAQDAYYFSYSLTIREASPNSTQPPIIAVGTEKSSPVRGG